MVKVVRTHPAIEDRRPWWFHRGRLACGCALTALLWGGGFDARGEEAPTPAEFDKTSLALRTALHFDPSVESPLTSLVQLYQRAGKGADLIALYTTHLAQYPQDAGARVVLARIYVEMRDARAGDFLKQAVDRHPDDALLAWVHAQWLGSRFDPKALDEMDRALGLEPVGAFRRSTWLVAFLRAAASQNREDVAAKRCDAMRKAGIWTLPQQIAWASRAMEAGLPRAAAVLLDGVDPARLDGEPAVEAMLLLSRVALANGSRDTAARWADQLVERLAADHWRRREALILRLQCAEGELGRRKLLDEAQSRWKAQPDSEAEALSYGELLLAAGNSSDAVDVWRATLKRMPSSRAIEARLLELLDRGHRDEEMLAVLDEQLKRQPAREDLKLQRVRQLLSMGRGDEGLQAMDALIGAMEPSQRAPAVLQTARWLRQRNLLVESSRLLEQLIQRDPQLWEVRKELAELYGALKRRDDMARLFQVEMAEATPPEVRLEVAQFLLAQKMWPSARRLIEPWVARRPVEFDGRLLLARICTLMGDDAAAERYLDECRDRADTEARYAAWLAAALERADESETVDAFVAAERKRLLPANGESWTPAALSRLLALQEQSGRLSKPEEIEQGARKALEAPGMEPEVREALELSLIDAIQAQQGRGKEVESALLAAIERGGRKAEDLRLRLVLLYADARRYDLMRDELKKMEVNQCTDQDRLSRCAAHCASVGAMEEALPLLERLVRLAPDERQHWIQWTTTLAQLGDEEALRNALAEARSRAGKWKLTDEAQDLLRRHSCASCWRSAARLLTASGATMDQELMLQLRTLLDGVEEGEFGEQRRLWSVWVRGMIGRRAGNSGDVQRAIAALSAASAEWVDFPDGMSLSKAHALDELKNVAVREESSSPKPVSRPCSAPFSMGWGFLAPRQAAIQRWALTSDGRSVLVADSRDQLHALNRATGKLRWSASFHDGNGNPAIPVPARSMSQERVDLPVEWALNNEALALLADGALIVRDVESGKVLWRAPISPGLASTSGVRDTALAADDSSIYLWQAGAGRLLAFDSRSGKLRWQSLIDALARAPRPNSNQPQWVSAGVQIDGGHLLVWGSGTAVLRAADGRVLRQSTREAVPAFPLELQAEGEDAPTMTSGGVVAQSWNQPATLRSTSRRYGASGSLQFSLVNPMSVVAFGFPGSYGSVSMGSWVTWGSDGFRLLQGDRLWMVDGGSGLTRVSVFGIPSGGTPPLMSQGALVGTVGNGLVLQRETTLFRVLADGAVGWSWNLNSGTYQSKPDQHPLPAAAVAGRQVFLCTRDALQVGDAFTGEVAWTGSYPDEVRSWIGDGWSDLARFQSMRISSRGIAFYDGQNTSLMIDWKTAAADGDWIVPAGLTRLVCLRGANPMADAGTATKGELTH